MSYMTMMLCFCWLLVVLAGAAGLVDPSPYIAGTNTPISLPSGRQALTFHSLSNANAK
jgi:hypothetical protein